MLTIETIHHVSLPVTDLDRSKAFYTRILGLREIDRPPFDFPGCWYQLGDRQLHLTVSHDPTFRAAKGADSRDIHFAVRVRSLREVVEFLRSRGYREDLEAGALLRMKVNLEATAGFPQVYVLDPDRHVVEINAEGLDA